MGTNPSTPQEPPRKLRVLLAGYGHLGFALLQGLVQTPHVEIVGVYRWSSRPNTESFWDVVEAQFLQAVQHYGLRDISCPGINGYEFTELLTELKPDVLLIGSWGEILKPHLLELPGMLAVNCHPSKLPAHRGANPYATVIRFGDTETGVSFHRIAPKIDAGNLFLQETVPVDPNESGASLRDKCAIVAYNMVPVLMARIMRHVFLGEPLEEIEQDHSKKSYYPSLKSEDGLVDWEAGPDVFWAQFRSLYPWVVCYSYIGGQKIILMIDPVLVPNPTPHTALAGTIVKNEKSVLYIATTDPARVIRLATYQIEGGRKMYHPAWFSRWISLFSLGRGARLMNMKD